MKHTENERAAYLAALSRVPVLLTVPQREQLLKHLDLVIEKNKELNLTRITSFEEAVILHIEDSLAILPEFNETTGRYCDIGTGAGFPGIPLAIATGREGVLIDSVKKKAFAVYDFVKELGFSQQIKVSGLRSEELAVKEPESFDVVIARAVAALPIIEELGAPLLRSNGFLIAMKGSESIEDLKRAEIASEKVGLKLVSERKFKIGDGAYDRSVYVFQKVGEPQVKLPRRPGMAVKRPLA